MGLLRKDEARIAGGQHDFRRRIEIGELEFALDDADQSPDACLGVVAGAQGGRKRVLIENRRGSIGADISHGQTAAWLVPAGSGPRSRRQKLASCRLSAVGAALAVRALSRAVGLSSV